MRIIVAYNIKTKNVEEQAELLLQEDVDRICKALKDLNHTAIPVEVSGKIDEIIEKIVEAEPEFIFNVAEGIFGESREAFYPIIYESLGIPFTGSNSSLLLLSLNKHLTKSILAAQGINVPKGVLITKNNQKLPENLKYPLFIKPNIEGSSIGISQKSVVTNENECLDRINEIIEKFPAGLIIEEFIRGRELSIPMLEAFQGQILEIVEHTFKTKSEQTKYNIYDFDSKFNNTNSVKVICPAKLDKDERNKVLETARQAFKILDCKDMGRIDIRLHEDGTPYFIEANPLPSLHPLDSLMQAAKARKLSYKEVINLILKSALKHSKVDTTYVKAFEGEKIELPKERLTLREEGISFGYFEPGKNNSITDVPGVKVGHLTYIKDNIEIPGTSEITCVRTGVTTVIPAEGCMFDNPIAAGGFVLNGIGEMAGLTQVLEWEWLETPIMLCNTMSVGRVHDGIVSYMTEQSPSLHSNNNVVIPLVAEADDSYLNDTRIKSIIPSDIKHTINSATSGKIAQGSVGAGTGMVTFDFAGGIGTSSRKLPKEDGGYTVGALVLSNFGAMRNLTIGGKIIGKELLNMFPEKKRTHSWGSIIVVIGTSAPLLSSQLNRLSKRAALGLGRVGSIAHTTSGEIIISFSTANQIKRDSLLKSRCIDVKFASNCVLNSIYEAVIEAVEEAVINAIFCSNGVKGFNGNYSPPIPHDEVLKILRQNL